MVAAWTDSAVGGMGQAPGLGRPLVTSTNWHENIIKVFHVSGRPAGESNGPAERAIWRFGGGLSGRVGHVSTTVLSEWGKPWACKRIDPSSLTGPAPPSVPSAPGVPRGWHLPDCPRRSYSTNYGPWAGLRSSPGLEVAWGFRSGPCAFPPFSPGASVLVIPAWSTSPCVTPGGVAAFAGCNRVC
jgi:hypothetical protein